MIGVRGLNKVFRTGKGSVAALHEANVEIGDTEFFVLLGPSGSGKTTLLRCVAGLETPDSGEIYFDDTVIYSSAQRRNVPPEDRRIGMVFQSYAIWPHLTVGQNVALPLTHGTHRPPRSVVKDRVREALRAVRMEGYEDRPAPMLSGGQQQRVALARALAVEPAILLMDEPLSNLDARLREEVRFEIREVAKRVAVPVLYVTHDQVEAMAVADRIGVMDAGQILQVDTPFNVYSRPVDATVASFLGSMNWVVGHASGPGCIISSIGKLVAPASDQVGPVRVGIRPESLALSTVRNGSPNTLAATVREASFLGDHVLYRLEVETISLIAKSQDVAATLSVGAAAYVTIAPESILVYPGGTG